MKNTKRDVAEEIAWEQRDAFEDFVGDLLLVMRKAHKEFAAQEAKTVEMLGEKPDRAVLRKLVRERIEQTWGDDEMLPLLTRALVDGDFSF